MDTYEKKYKDANDKVAARFGTNVAKEIFADLYESEDEKIRKWLIGYFHQYKEDGMEKYANGLKVESIIAWLEKQGEKKPFDYENANIQQKDFAPQKDIPRYSIGDVLCNKSCTTLNKESQSNFEITDIRNGMYICDKCSFPISQQDEYELVAKRIEQKPTDLEEFINELSKQFPDVSFAKLSRIAVRVAKWAKPIDEEMKELLRTEYEKGRADTIAEIQKPAWSEEDERILDALITSLNNEVFTRRLETLKGIGVSLVIDWLKSLKQRYIWKPNKEQLDALKRTQTGVIQFSILQNLYNDLKKL